MEATTEEPKKIEAKNGNGKNRKRKEEKRRKHHKEIMLAFEAFKSKFPEAIKEEIIAEGEYFTLARVSATLGKDVVIGEGLARRSGNKAIDPPNPWRAKEISIGRANTALATKLAYRKPWVKLRSHLMG